MYRTTRISLASRVAWRGLRCILGCLPIPTQGVSSTSFFLSSFLPWLQIGCVGVNHQYEICFLDSVSMMMTRRRQQQQEEHSAIAPYP